MDFNQNKTGPVDVTKHDRLAKLKAYMRKKPSKKRLAIVGGIGLGVLIAGTVMAFTLIRDDSVVTPAVIPEPAPIVEEKFYSPLTGVEVAKNLAERPVTGVMIENSIDARPQAGLEEAGIVFEAIAEGGITRFMALYQEGTPGKIGPIRSARPYYVQWAKGFDAAYAHSGGSPVALQLIQTIGLKDLDHGRSPGYFDRVSNRFAPHNVYTSMQRLDQYKNDKGYTSSEYKPLARVEVDDKEVEVKVEVEAEESASPTTTTATTAIAPNAVNLAFAISSARYNTSYSYDSAAGLYRRSMSGQPHVDEVSGKQISPKVVIALYTDYGIASNNIHSVYRTTGTGEADVFQNGKLTKAQWRKVNESSPLEILTADGKKPLPLERGQTWITALQNGRVTASP